MRLSGLKLLFLLSCSGLAGAWLAAPEETLRTVGAYLDEAFLPRAAQAQEGSGVPDLSPVKAEWLAMASA